MVDHAFLQPESGVSFIDEEGGITVMVATSIPIMIGKKLPLH